MKSHFAIIVLAAGAWLSAQAAELTDTIDLTGEVLVIESAVKAPVALLPLDVNIIDSRAIDNSTESNLLPVLQNRVPGLFTTERGIGGYGVSGGSAGAVNIRGVGGGNRVLFMIDGQPQWAGVFGHSLPDTYVTNDVESVEVVSGPSSLLYGSGAMGGSVNLITRRAGRDGVYGAIRAMGGSYGTQKYGARVGWKQGGWRLLGAATYESSNGSRKGMDYWLSNQYVNASYQFNHNWEAGANVMVTETKANNPGEAHRALPLDMWAKQLRTSASIFVKDRYDITSGGFQAYVNWGKHDIDDGLDRQNKPRTYLFHSKDYNMGLTLYQTVNPWHGNDLSVGFDLKHWGGKAYNTDKTTNDETPIVDKHVTETGVYAMMQQALLNDRLSLNAGVRHEHSSQFGGQWVPQAGLIVRPLPHSRIKFNYAKGFRSPNIRELYMYEARNSDLKPESMHNLEVELRQWLIKGNLNIGLCGYWIKGENLIQTVRVHGKPRNINTGRFINKGIEADVDFYINSDWNISANYAFLHTDKRIVAAPRHKLFGEVDFTPGNWQFTVDCMYVRDLHTEQTTETYALLNARVAYTFGLKQGAMPLTLFAKSENLTAAKYQINYGFPMPKATLIAGVEWKF